MFTFFPTIWLMYFHVVFVSYMINFNLLHINSVFRMFC